MKLSCIHCGSEFSITADQLGGRGRCPHCHGEIQLPRAEEDHAPEHHAPAPVMWLEGSIAMLGSMIVHMAIVILLTLFTYGGSGLPGDTEEVMIGSMPDVKLDAPIDEEFQEEEDAKEESEIEALEDPLEELETLAAEPNDPSVEFTEVMISPTGGGKASFDLKSLNSGGAMGGKGDWDGMIRTLQRNGLDIVISFDSTGSMSGEISEVKRQVNRIGTTLFKLIPKTRISICTYRDEGQSEAYLVKGLPLTGDLEKVKDYLSDIYAGGGGDTPEAVHAGLSWPIKNNDFGKRARKVILIFGDAPPHQQYLKDCLNLAGTFSGQQRGIVSTITCRHEQPMPEFVQIAQHGGGEAFLTRDEREIMTQLLVLVFGKEHRSKVVEAFKLMER